MADFSAGKRCAGYAIFVAAERCAAEISTAQKKKPPTLRSAALSYRFVLVRTVYRSRASTFCGFWLAIWSTEVPDCTRI